MFTVHLMTVTMKHMIALLCIVGFVHAQDGGILFPEKEGFDIGLIFISDSCFSWNQYELLGEQIQYTILFFGIIIIR